MIDIINKNQCCGCEGCVQVCPTNCISFVVDSEGFQYPKVDVSRCVECEKCESVCPVIHKAKRVKPMAIYAAKSFDEQIRQESSSGGVFTLLAEQVIAKGGVVFGAKFDSNWGVEHSYTTSKEGLELFRGSKYTQSKIGRSYIDVKEFLNDGKSVMFSGTPCQVAGLKQFLGKDYENLFTIDIICHGVPSPRVWGLYREELLKRNNASHFTHINFRHKGNGWKNYSLRAEIQTPQSCEEVIVPLRRNAFMRGFLKGTFSRPVCYSCPSKESRSGADITIADFWGIEMVIPKFDDDKGTSMAIINTKRGAEAFGALDLESKRVRRWCVQRTYYRSAKPNKKRAEFFEALDLRKDEYVSEVINAYTKPTRLKKFTRSLNKFFTSLFKR